MVIPAGTITASVARGATPVDQFVPVSQGPDNIAVFAFAIPELKSRKKVKVLILMRVFVNMGISFIKSYDAKFRPNLTYLLIKQLYEVFSKKIPVLGLFSKKWLAKNGSNNALICPCYQDMQRLAPGKYDFPSK
jgi:hypothetical protein